MLAVGNDELGRTIEEQETCPNCGEKHKVEATSILHFVRCDQKTFLIGVKGRLLPPPRAKRATPKLDKEALGVRATEAVKWEWRDGMRVLRWSYGLPDHLAVEGRVGAVDRRFITRESIPDLEDAPTRGALLQLIRDLIGDSSISPLAYASDEGTVWRLASVGTSNPSWFSSLQSDDSEADLLVQTLNLIDRQG